MQLREKLAESTRQKLLDQARSFELSKCSGLRKDQLIDKIVTCFCSEEMFHQKVKCTQDEMVEMNMK